MLCTDRTEPFPPKRSLPQPKYTFIEDKESGLRMQSAVCGLIRNKGLANLFDAHLPQCRTTHDAWFDGDI